MPAIAPLASNLPNREVEKQDKNSVQFYKVMGIKWGRVIRTEKITIRCKVLIIHIS